MGDSDSIDSSDAEYIEGRPSHNTFKPKKLFTALVALTLIAPMKTLLPNNDAGN